jgi:hypothetical protein
LALQAAVDDVHLAEEWIGEKIAILRHWHPSGR